MSATRKVKRWDGPNKRKARSRKSMLIRHAVADGFLPQNPHVLSFAGAKAHFERSLTARDITVPENIVTVQTCLRIGGHDGGHILSKLIKLRDQEFPGMRIWPYTFSSFSKGYTPEQINIPSFERNKPRWYQNPKWRQEMFNFLDCSAPQFDVVDADLCGVFSEKNGEDISHLFRAGALNEQGLLFVNHQKGRDGRFGKLFAFLREYYRICSYFDISSIGELDLSTENDLSFHYVRYVLVPVYYICEAFAAGYMLTVDRLVEYRDRNPSSRTGVTMLQWYFRWQRRESDQWFEEGNLAAYSAALEKELEELGYTLELVACEAYPYTDAVD